MQMRDPPRGGPVEPGGAVVGPFAGALVRPEGERAAVKQLGGGALLLSRTPVAPAVGSSLPHSGGKLLRRPGKSWSRIWHDYSIRVRVSFGFLDFFP
jgi:hypothetical protein